MGNMNDRIKDDRPGILATIFGAIFNWIQDWLITRKLNG